MKRAPVSRVAACALAVGFVLGLPARAKADDTRPLPWEGGVRLGVALPMGNVDALTGDSLSATVGALVPVWVDLGVRLGEHVYVGPYGVFGVGSDGNAVSGCGCAILYGGVGLNALFHLRPTERVDPWFGAGGGFEALAIDAGNEPGLNGWESEIEAGVDWLVEPSVRVGPFAAFSLGEFINSPGTYNLGNNSQIPAPSAFHEWLTLGVRVAFGGPSVH